MKFSEFPDDIRNYLIPEPSGSMFYRCLGCRAEFDIDHLLYTCPSCGGILMLYHQPTGKIKNIDGALWRRIFDYRGMLNLNPLRVSSAIMSSLPPLSHWKPYYISAKLIPP